MPAVYDRVRAAAWLPASSDASLTARYRALPFPEQWRDVMLDLCNTGRPEDAELYRTVPTYRMDQVLQTLAPDHLVLGRPFSGQGDAGYWLLVPEGTTPLPEPAFRALRNAWLNDLRPDIADSHEYRDLLSRARNLLDESPPSWRPVELELLRCPVTDGGTAAPLDHQYPLTTDWIARRVLALEPYDFDGGRLRFHAVPRGPRDQGAELVSEPLPFETRGRTWWYSVRLNITLHTVPFERLPRIHLHAGIRRWATRVSTTTGRLHLPPGRKTTVLLRPRVPWLRGAPVSDRFAVASLERRWDREAGAWTAGWAYGGPTGILRRISLAEPFPDAEEVLTSPEKWLIDDMRAAVVHSTAMGRHGVGTGLMSDQRSKIVAWAEAAIPAELCPVPERVRTTLGSSAPSSPKGPSRAERVRKAAAYAMTCMGVPGTDEPPVLEARLLWQTPEMRDTAIDALCSHLGLVHGDRPGGTEYRDAAPGTPVVLEWRTSELVVRLRCLRLTGGLGTDLPFPDGGRPAKAAVTDAIATRRDEAARFLMSDRPGPVPSIALVELDRAADFTTAHHDPKFALRLGFAEAGVLTQFLAVPKKVKGYNSIGNAEHRALKAWDDGLRQLGARVHTPPGPATGVPAGMRFASVWMVRRNRKSSTRWAGLIPIAVLMTPGPEDGTVRVQGWDAAADDGAGDWIPYPAMLLRLTQYVEISSVASGAEEEDSPAARPSRRRSREDQRRATGEWLQKVQRSLRGAPTMLLADAQNARSCWTWLQDGTVEADRIRTGHAPGRRLDPDLRLVRVRTGQGRETAQWWGVNRDDGPNGLPSHLWVPQKAGRVFWSTTPKPVQFQSSAVVADKLGGRRLTQGPRVGELTVDTDKPAWNPSLVEIAILGCHETDGDIPEALALLVHHLRQPADYPEALSLPLPLHLAGLAQQYVLPLPPESSGG